MQANELTGAAPTGDPAEPHAAAGALRVEFRPIDPAAALPAGLLAAVRFGVEPAPSAAALCIDVGLSPLDSGPVAELWWASGPVTRGTAGAVRYAHDDRHLMAVLDIDERDHADIAAAGDFAYNQMRHFQQQSEFTHLLRMWNYLDAINMGEGDLERYREFCVGRTRGLGDAVSSSYPAATAIGHQDTTRRLQVYWLASRTAGAFLENPRQVSAYRYPRTHGPASPTFARATLAADGTLLISGTASIVGHLSLHSGDPLAQLDETLRNLAALDERAAALSPALAAKRSREHGLFKVYVREPAQLDAIRSRLRQVFPLSPTVFLAADVCRRELLLEIEVLHGSRTS